MLDGLGLTLMLQLQDMAARVCDSEAALRGLMFTATRDGKETYPLQPYTLNPKPCARLATSIVSCVMVPALFPQPSSHH